MPRKNRLHVSVGRYMLHNWLLAIMGLSQYVHVGPIWVKYGGFVRKFHESPICVCPHRL